MQRKIIYGVISFVVVGLVSGALLLSFNPTLSDSTYITGSIIFAIIGGALGLALAGKLNSSLGDGETISTLRWWFIVAGLLSMAATLEILPDSGISFALNLQGAIQIILGLITLYIGFNFKNLIQKSRKFIINFLYLEVIYSIIATLISLMNPTEHSSFIATTLIGGILLQVYLISNINRLSKK